jgi:hypothetical protein
MTRSKVPMFILNAICILLISMACSNPETPGSTAAVDQPQEESPDVQTAGEEPLPGDGAVDG